MLEIETAIMALGPEAQRRVIDWVRSRWVDSNGHANGDVTAGQVEPQFAIRGTPLTSPWPHEQAAKASSFREGVLAGGIGGEDVDQLISAYDEAESLSVVFETGPSAQTTSLFRKLAGDVEYRQRMRPFPQHPTPWWLATAWMLSKLKDAELERAIQNLSFNEGYKAAKEHLPRHWYGPEWWGGEEQWSRAKAIVLGNTSKDDEGIFPAAPGDEESIALDVAEVVAGVRHHGIDPAALWNTTFREQADAPVDEASAMLDEAEWAADMLGRLRSSNPVTLLCALQEIKRPGVEERLRNITSPETVNKAYADAVRHYPDGKADKARAVDPEDSST